MDYRLDGLLRMFVLYFLIIAFHTSVGQDTTFNYLPHSKDEFQTIEYENYSLAYSEEHEQALWVAYELTEYEAISNIAVRSDDFREDQLVISGSAALSDYRRSGFDRGHLAPAGDFGFSHSAMSESFYMTNMSPQNPGFNRGIWKKLESLVRVWAIENKQIYIITGGVLDNPILTIGDNKVAVPQYFYKVVLDYTIPGIKSIAFLLKNEPSSQPLQEFVISIDSVESLTGIDFFSHLEDHLEHQLESPILPSEWTWTTNYTKPEQELTIDRQAKPVRCKGIAKSTGKRCKQKAIVNTAYCRYHRTE